MDVPSAERTLVLGDFSPKNILVHSGGLILLDFECAHAGDATFDLGFFFTHLFLKAFRAELGEGAHAGRPNLVGQPNASQVFLSLCEAFWRGYEQRTGFGPSSSRGRKTVTHLAACALARVDGKSPVEYLDDRAQRAAREFARSLLATDS